VLSYNPTVPKKRWGEDRPKVTQVSVRGEIYAMLKEEAAKRGCKVTELVEFILEKYEAGVQP